MQDLRQFLIKWNNLFPYDRLYRQKHKIAFNSEEHRKVNQINVICDLYEDFLVEEAAIEQKKWKEREVNYKKGNLFTDTPESPEVVSELFDKLDVTQYKSED